MIKIKNLKKTINGVDIVDIKEMNIKTNRIYGFLGANGAGKSTTMKMIAGLMKPTSGQIEFTENNKSIGALIEEPSYYPNLTAYENLLLIQKLIGFDKSNIEKVLEIVGLTKAKDKVTKKFSLGMKQRLGIALAIVHSPDFLILDEPTNGLDPIGIKEVRKTIMKLPKLFDTTVIVSSHILSEIDLIADDIGIIKEGRLLYEGSKEQLERNNQLLLRTNDNQRVIEVLGLAMHDFSEYQRYIVLEEMSDEKVGNMVYKLVNSGVKIYEIKIETSTLEEMFLRITQEVI